MSKFSKLLLIFILLHFCCHSQNQPQTDTISVSHGEFNCPMCRQLSNSVIPIMPEENKMSVAKPVSKDTTSMVLDLAEMMYQSPGWTVSNLITNIFVFITRLICAYFIYIYNLFIYFQSLYTF